MSEAKTTNAGGRQTSEAWPVRPAPQEQEDTR